MEGLLFLSLVLLVAVFLAVAAKKNMKQTTIEPFQPLVIPTPGPPPQPIDAGAKAKPYNPPSAEILTAPFGETSDVTSRPFQDPSLDKAPYSRLYELLQDMNAFHDFELEKLQDKSDPAISLPLNTFKGDRQRLIDEVAFLNRATINITLKKYDLALSDLNSAISIDNRFPDLYYPLAEVMVKLKDLDGAISAYSEYIKLIPNSPQAYFDRGLIKYRNGDKLGACEDAQFSKSLNGLPIVGRTLEMLLENSCSAKEHDDVEESIDETVAFALVDEVPVFPGCEEVLKSNRRSCFQKQIQMHIAKNFRYPRIAQKEKIQGRVFVQFTIDIDGGIEGIRTRGPHPLLEKEANRIISLLPKITPGSKNGKLVKVPFSIPITFALK